MKQGLAKLKQAAALLEEFSSMQGQPGYTPELMQAVEQAAMQVEDAIGQLSDKAAMLDQPAGAPMGADQGMMPPDQGAMPQDQGAMMPPDQGMMPPDQAAGGYAGPSLDQAQATALGDAKAAGGIGALVEQNKGAKAKGTASKKKKAKAK